MSHIATRLKAKISKNTLILKVILKDKLITEDFEVLCYLQSEKIGVVVLQT